MPHHLPVKKQVISVHMMPSLKTPCTQSPFKTSKGRQCRRSTISDTKPRGFQFCPAAFSISLNRGRGRRPAANSIPASRTKSTSSSKSWADRSISKSSSAHVISWPLPIRAAISEPFLKTFEYRRFGRRQFAPSNPTRFSRRRSLAVWRQR